MTSYPCHSPWVQYIPRNMHTVFALLCFVVVIHWLIFPYPSGLLHWHCGNLTIAPVPAKQPWWIWRNTSCEFIMNDCITTTKQSTKKPCAYFLGYTVGINSGGRRSGTSWSWATKMEPALQVPPGGSADLTWVVMKLAGYLSLIYITIIQGVDGSPFFAPGTFCAVSIVKIPKYRHCFHHCNGY